MGPNGHWFVIVPAVIMCMTLTVGFILMIRDSIRRRGKWGINFRMADTRCPQCGEPMPVVRVPKNVEQALWGGWTCECGCEVNKWGREVEQ